jgi:hypothetical protein
MTTAPRAIRSRLKRRQTSARSLGEALDLDSDLVLAGEGWTTLKPALPYRASAARRRAAKTHAAALAGVTRSSDSRTIRTRSFPCRAVRQLATIASRKGLHAKVAVAFR